MAPCMYGTRSTWSHSGPARLGITSRTSNMRRPRAFWPQRVWMARLLCGRMCVCAICSPSDATIQHHSASSFFLVAHPSQTWSSMHRACRCSCTTKMRACSCATPSAAKHARPCLVRLRSRRSHACGATLTYVPSHRRSRRRFLRACRHPVCRSTSLFALARRLDVSACGNGMTMEKCTMSRRKQRGREQSPWQQSAKYAQRSSSRRITQPSQPWHFRRSCCLPGVRTARSKLSMLSQVHSCVSSTSAQLGGIQRGCWRPANLRRKRPRVSV